VSVFEAIRDQLAEDGKLVNVDEPGEGGFGFVTTRDAELGIEYLYSVARPGTIADYWTIAVWVEQGSYWLDLTESVSAFVDTTGTP